VRPHDVRQYGQHWRDLRPNEASPVYTFGLDLGKLADHTALTILRSQEGGEETVYDAVHLERLPLKVRYTTVVDTIKDGIERLMASRPIPDVVLAVDYTGVGVAVLDIFLKADLGVPIVPIAIHGGFSVVHEDGVWRVPKADLVSILDVLFQNGRLKLSAGSPNVADLRKELQSFRKTFTKLGHATFGADERWREAPHDDLVLSAAIACWAAEHARPARWAPMSPEVSAWFREAGVAT